MITLKLVLFFVVVLAVVLIQGKKKKAKKIGPETFKGLRDQIFSLANGKELSAVVMETSYPNATFSLVAVSDGTASLYFSNGGGIIGAGQHEIVRKQALSLIQKAPEFMKYLKKTEETTLPKPGFTKFFLVTDKGIYTVEAL